MRKNKLLTDEEKQRESYLSLEKNYRQKQCSNTLEKVLQEHRKYVLEHGRTWLRR
jgi:hypothetical protein